MTLSVGVPLVLKRDPSQNRFCLFIEAYDEVFCLMCQLARIEESKDEYR